MLLLSPLEKSEIIFIEAPNKEAALAQLVAEISPSRIPCRLKADLLDRLLQREAFGTTAVGDQAALPHCFSDDVEEPVSILGISKKGVPFAALDGASVRAMFLTVFPNRYRGSELKLHYLKDAEALLRDTFFTRRLVSMDSIEEVRDFLRGECEHSSRGYSRTA